MARPSSGLGAPTLDHLGFGWLENQALFDRATSYARKADIARYEVIRRFGGVYLDTDMECLRPIDELITEDVSFFAGREASGFINISIFGASPSIRCWIRLLLPCRCHVS